MKFKLAGITLLASVITSTAVADMNLRMGNEGTYPPFSMVKPDGSLTGMEPDLARELCVRLNATCDIAAYEFKALLPSLITGKIDMIVSQLTPKPERLENSEFTSPILTNPTDWIVSEDWNKPLSAEGLSGANIGMIKGSWFLDATREYAPDANLKLYDNINQIALDLEAGRIDMVLGGRINWARKFADNSVTGYKLVPNEAFKGGNIGRSWAVTKGNTELLDKVNAALEAMFEDCTYTKIRTKYIPVSISEREPAECQ